MNTDWAHGGSSIIAPLAVPLVGPDYGSHIIYADCQAAMIKATRVTADTVGHYARPDVLRLLVRRNDAWAPASTRVPLRRELIAPCWLQRRIATKSIYPRWKTRRDGVRARLITALSCHAIGRPRKAARGRESSGWLAAVEPVSCQRRRSRRICGAPLTRSSEHDSLTFAAHDLARQKEATLTKYIRPSLAFPAGRTLVVSTWVSSQLLHRPKDLRGRTQKYLLQDLDLSVGPDEFQIPKPC